MSRFLEELHQRVDGAGGSRAGFAAAARRRWRRASSPLGKEWEQRETAKFREMEQRLQAALAAFEAESRETIQKILESAEQRKAAEQAERRVAKTKREFEEKARAAVFGEAPAAQDRGSQSKKARGSV